MVHLTRRSFLAAGAAGVAAVATRDLPAASRPELVWTDVEGWPIDGRAFADRKAPFDRLPARAEAVVREAVWKLSRDSAGMVVRFATTAPELHVRYRLSSDRLDMRHMPASGVSGVDLYGHDGKAWRWIEGTRPDRRDVAAKLFAGQPDRETPRHFLLYLPLYNGIEKLELGTPAAHAPTPLPPRAQRPILCYGTSILHGACASRPGLAWSAIVGRALDREVLNFGFSGNGRMEAEVAQFLVEPDPAVYVIDCLPNMTPELVAERTGPLVRQLRAARPSTPILLVEDRTFGNAWFVAKTAGLHRQRRRALRDQYQRLLADGVADLHYLAGAELLGGDDEGTTDGSHPNDLGMMRQAEQVLAALRPLLAD